MVYAMADFAAVPPRARNRPTKTVTDARTAAAGRDVDRPASPEAAARGRLLEVDALRIAAALAVVIYHYTFANPAGGLTHQHFDTINLLTRYGYLGVDLFFMISGFVVLLSAMNRRPDQFVVSRMVRLYPAFWVAVTITTSVMVLLSAGQFHVGPLQYVANLTMWNSLVNAENIDVVYWTLWAELRFYVLLFVLVWWGLTRRRLTLVMWAWLAVTVVLDAAVLPGPAQTLLTLALQPEWSHYFIAGMALCLTYRSGMTKQLAAILLCSYALAGYRAIDFGDQVGVRFAATIHRWAIIGIITAMFVVLALVALRKLRRFARPWMAVLSALTYPLYLVHDRVGVVLFNRLDAYVNQWVLLLLIVAAMLGLAYLIHRYVEKPFAPVLKRFLTRLTTVLR